MTAKYRHKISLGEIRYTITESASPEDITHVQGVISYDIEFTSTINQIVSNIKTG